MKSRYRTNPIVKNYIGKNVYQSTIYPKILESSNDIYIMTTENDRLDLLAKKYYDNPAYWWIICNANNLPKDSLFVKTNVQLRIPSNANLNKIFNDLEALNKNG